MTRIASQNSIRRESNPNAQPRSDARAAILDSVRRHLRLSAPHDARRAEHAPHDESAATFMHDPLPVHELTDSSVEFDDVANRVRVFRERLESVGGRGYEAACELEAADVLRGIIAEARVRGLKIDRVAMSDAGSVAELTRHGSPVADVSWLRSPTIEDLFGCDAGVTAAQYGIAETGTLVLVSEAERHRNISLVPPVHIAVLRAREIRSTLGEALRDVHEAPRGLSRTVTFVTGPSRTADIELTLALGVHGPQELHVIIIGEGEG